MRVQYRTRARDDIAEIYDYRAREHSANVAARVEGAIRRAIEMLARRPEFGSKTNHRHPVRRWPMHEYPYAIFYTVDRDLDVITILRVVASARVKDLRRLPGDG
jgi:plasmid stabilization system protein ParE